MALQVEVLFHKWLLRHYRGYAEDVTCRVAGSHSPQEAICWQLLRASMGVGNGSRDLPGENHGAFGIFEEAKAEGRVCQDP